MPNTTGAEKRINHLMFDGPFYGSPRTINGWRRQVHSYNLPIITTERGEVYAISRRNSSRTTNRHIQAAWNVLTNHGYSCTDEVPEDLGVRGARYVRWIKKEV